MRLSGGVVASGGVGVVSLKRKARSTPGAGSRQKGYSLRYTTTGIII
ncbi:hypothetical protein [Caudoviricetes sp.]|nr:hypothetical protein [Caudoviricetes sp.]UOF81097.1 hypothetical protein [Caudoviricetes sp.]UOF82222.1 hypothetical protein [Caudoviricetes sp.]UOF82442.1 hypothetical protein [Caudoviricetes sp.]UOF82641.1 hypothetical protein [Caudoviricetes sp.]